MCGRYGRRADKQRITEWMQTHNTNVFDETYLAPSYNVAPTDFQPIVRLDRDGQRELTIMRWGLVPYWAKDSKISFSTINAKSETVTTSPAFREAMKRRRCLVPAEWFYEWAKIEAKTKQPYAIGLSDGSLMTYTILTTDPNELTEPIHDRMPVILPPKDYQRWLEPGDPSHLPIDLLRPYPAEEMKAWKVGSAVGNVRNNEPGLIEPI
jgi:putative SOS response-associated peptidase YedK